MAAVSWTLATFDYFRRAALAGRLRAAILDRWPAAGEMPTYPAFR